MMGSFWEKGQIEVLSKGIRTKSPIAFLIIVIIIKQLILDSLQSQVSFQRIKMQKEMVFSSYSFLKSMIFPLVLVIDCVRIQIQIKSMVQLLLKLPCPPQMKDNTPFSYLSRGQSLHHKLSLRKILQQYPKHCGVLFQILVHKDVPELLKSQIFSMIHFYPLDIVDKLSLCKLKTPPCDNLLNEVFNLCVIVDLPKEVTEDIRIHITILLLLGTNLAWKLFNLLNEIRLFRCLGPCYQIWSFKWLFLGLRCRVICGGRRERMVRNRFIAFRDWKKRRGIRMIRRMLTEKGILIPIVVVRVMVWIKWHWVLIVAKGIVDIHAFY